MAAKDHLVDVTLTPEGFSDWAHEVSELADDALQPGGTVTITDPTNEQVLTVNVVDDSSPTGNWPDRIRLLFDGAEVTWFNEYGEYRGTPAKNNTVGWRLFVARTPTSYSNRNNTVPVLQVVSDRTDRTPLFEVYGDGKVMAAGEVTAPNVGVPIRAVLDHDEEPVNPQPGDIYLVRPEPEA